MANQNEIVDVGPRYCMMTGAQLGPEEVDFCAEAKAAILRAVKEGEAPAVEEEAPKDPEPAGQEEGE